MPYALISGSIIVYSIWTQVRKKYQKSCFLSYTYIWSIQKHRKKNVFDTFRQSCVQMPIRVSHRQHNWRGDMTLTRIPPSIMVINERYSRYDWVKLCPCGTSYIFEDTAGTAKALLCKKSVILRFLDGLYIGCCCCFCCCCSFCCWLLLAAAGSAAATSRANPNSR